MTMHSRPSRRREQTEAFVNQAAVPETVQLHCLIPSATHRRLRILAAQEGTTVTRLVLAALEGYLAERD
jgi:hypothetical protein